jgi:hypothetical protein
MFQDMAVNLKLSQPRRAKPSQAVDELRDGHPEAPDESL